ncbi:MAG TPA: alpha-L-rhamnosidase C-terminal domain-containing protein, partial [Clostridia bacterium]|nr:alpha-L-rhamnosidase C-terminal domain-containing protein [Clostridia bacterium]
YFDLAPNKKELADDLARMVVENGNKLKTGFLGTPYLLHVLSENGHADVAYSLLLQEEYPSWLYPVNKGATTIWERWGGIMPDGTLNDKRMNSFNHYAYGAVGDWLYGGMAGINADENAPGFKHIIFKPLTDPRIDYAKASIKTASGEVSSYWRREGDKIRYEFKVPSGSTATIYIGDKVYNVTEGHHAYTV